MTAVELAWWNYKAAERRVDACRAANDRAGLLIAQSQARRWNEMWLAALTAADGAAEPTGPIARPAA